jgi:hypothetical protein
VALRSDGNLVAWGDNSYGQTNIPSGATNIIAIAAGWYGNAALRANGTVLIWGSIGAPPSSFTNNVDLALFQANFTFSSTFSSLLGIRRDGKLALTSGTLPLNATNIVALGAGSVNGMALIGSGPPIFPQKLLNRSVAVGATAYFRTLAIGALPLSYQWICNGTNISGATNSILAVNNVQLSQTGNSYSLIASNTLGIVTNNASTLNVTPFEAYLQPQALSVPAGSTATFTVSTIGQGPFTYQWLLNGTILVNATNAILTQTNVQLTSAGNYSVSVTNAYGNISANTTLVVQPFMFDTSSANLFFSTNGLQLQLIGVFATNSVILYASTDLVSWLPILTNSPATDSLQFLDSSATNWPQRFYRAAEQ